MTDEQVKIDLERDENGLVVGVDYYRNIDGTINWRKMIKPEFLVPNSQKTDETDVSILEDHELLILLAGTKELAYLRGFKEVTYEIPAASENYVLAKCRIKWIPNFETNGESIVFESMADAHQNNTNAFGKLYLAAIAENRAFVRAVRNFLRIHIVSKEELNDASIQEDKIGNREASVEPHILLVKLMKEKGINFDRIKKRLEADGDIAVGGYNTVEDIPKPTVFTLIDRLKNLKTTK